jgi:hypothetical protein
MQIVVWLTFQTSRHILLYTYLESKCNLEQHWPTSDATNHEFHFHSVDCFPSCTWKASGINYILNYCKVRAHKSEFPNCIMIFLVSLRNGIYEL